MALSTRKKNLIIADWKTGKYSSYYAIAKVHKISEYTAKKILVNLTHSNAHIVEAGVVYEDAKKLSKNSVEIKAIENAVNERVRTDDLSDLVLDGVEGLLRGGKAQKVVTVGMGDGLSSADIVKYDLQADDYKKIQETIDKASVTKNINPRFSSTATVQNNINNSNNQQTNLNEIKVKFLED